MESEKSGEYAVQNVVVTGRLADKMVLVDMHNKISGSVYEPGKFPALRIKRFGVGFLLYSSGNFVCSGARSTELAQEKVDGLVEVLNSSGFDVACDKIEVRNIVVSVDLHKSLRLHELAYAIPDSEYDPEAFPGMKLRKGSTRILVFRTGKAIIPGLRTIEEIESTIGWLKNTIISAEEEIDTYPKPSLP
ncbi:MAG: hypothetical protein GOU98_00875 [Candidatus Altiarchaeota archaeon]|nr:hypothetical protein [Candidatus Altiarchaeota archaeon]